MATIPPITSIRADNLALLYQEVLTVVVRLRAGRLRFNGIDVFRNQIRGAIETAEREGMRRGYTTEDVRLATFAVVAFLDESILNSRNPAFGDWQRKPLQEELFGRVEAGEIIFRNIERLLGRTDSEPLADVLEIHQLVLLLGLRGRFSASNTAGEVRAIVQQIEEKIRRIRGGLIQPAWQPPQQTLAKPVDPWVPALKWMAIGCALVSALLFVVFKFSLSSAVAELGSLASQLFS